jgi:hypothetical protein
METCAITSS